MRFRLLFCQAMGIIRDAQVPTRYHDSWPARQDAISILNTWYSILDSEYYAACVLMHLAITSWLSGISQGFHRLQGLNAPWTGPHHRNRPSFEWLSSCSNPERRRRYLAQGSMPKESGDPLRKNPIGIPFYSPSFLKAEENYDLRFSLGRIS